MILDGELRATDGHDETQREPAIHAHALSTDGQPAGDSRIPRIETHWSRILHYDFFAAGSRRSTADPGETTRGEVDRPAPGAGAGPLHGQNTPRRGGERVTLLAADGAALRHRYTRR
jgi:hypothetical protein